MNYFVLKSVIEAAIAQFRCKNCNGNIGETDITLLGMAGAHVNMEITCPHCGLQGVVKAEIGVMGLDKKQAMISHIKQMIDSFRTTHNTTTSNNIALNDSDIKELREELKKHSTIESLLAENPKNNPNAEAESGASEPSSS
jgi:DNA-directed RNA polymerase subunit RPC12/RpoP